MVLGLFLAPWTMAQANPLPEKIDRSILALHQPTDSPTEISAENSSSPATPTTKADPNPLALHPSTPSLAETDLARDSVALHSPIEVPAEPATTEISEDTELLTSKADAVEVPAESATTETSEDAELLTSKADAVEVPAESATTEISEDTELLTSKADAVEISAVTTSDHTQLTHIPPQSIATQVPTPGTTLTKASALTANPTIAQAPDGSESTPPPLTEQEVVPGSATRTSYSFIGLGANIGMTGSKNALTNDVSFVVFSKIGMTPDLSVRPTFFIRNDVYITLPLTFDFSPWVLPGGLRVGPYFGGGVAISTGNSSYVRPLLTTGVDVPLGPQFTGTAGFNFAFYDSVDVGFNIGIGYNFSGF